MNPLVIERFLRPVLPFLFTAWMIIVLYFTIAPPELIRTASSWIHPGFGHVVLFGGWTTLLGFTLLINMKKNSLPLFIIWLSGVLFGAVIEVLQFVMPYGRTGSLTDVGLNTIGCTVAIILLAGYMKFRNPYLKSA